MLDVLRTISIICLGRYRAFCTEFQQDESRALTQRQGTPMPPCGTHRLQIQESRPASNWIFSVRENHNGEFIEHENTLLNVNINCMCASCMRICVWRPEVDTGYCPQALTEPTVCVDWMNSDFQMSSLLP